MIKKFRKKPIIIEALQNLPINIEEIKEWLKGKYEIKWGHLVIKTIEGEMTCNDGDWIIKGIKGEFYPCKPEIFEQTYEEVSLIRAN